MELDPSGVGLYEEQKDLGRPTSWIEKIRKRVGLERRRVSEDRQVALDWES